MPALMIVPGPHFINSVDDLLENHMETNAFRLMLAMSIVFAGAFGVLLGGWLALSGAPQAALVVSAMTIGLVLGSRVARLFQAAKYRS